MNENTSTGLNIDIAYNNSGIANVIFEFFGYAQVIYQLVLNIPSSNYLPY